MNRLISLCLIVGSGLVAFCAAGLFGRAPGIRGEESRDSLPAVTAAPVLSVGVAGCASTACHGGPASDSLTGKLDSHTWAGSATHWMAVDPHTQAYAALESPFADEIVLRMHSTVKATDDVRCLACHTNPTLATQELSAHERRVQREGVSCEACHGAATKWLHSHRTWTAASRASGYEQSGMAKLYDLGERALACAGCHVGAPADPARGYPVRDMNHDMLAAGHPRLNFDFADYQRRLTPHWFERDRASGLSVGPGFELKAWLVGRAAHVEAASLLRVDRESRAKRNDPSTPWPEFAEWSCVSCHHNVDGKFPASLGKLVRQSLWPFEPDRPPASANLVAMSDNDCQRLVETHLKNVNVESLDRDSAGQVYHGLAARERARMRQEGRHTFDSSLSFLKESLALPRGNLDYRLKPETKVELKRFLDQK